MVAMAEVAPRVETPLWPCLYGKVSVDNLFVDSEYQRTPNQAWIRKTAENFDVDLFGAITCSQRTNGYAILDGQQRWMVARMVGIKTVPSLYYKNLTREQEAKIFIGMNFDRKQVGAWFHYRALRYAGDPKILDIEAIVRSAGFTVGSTASADDYILSIPGTVMAIYGGGGEFKSADISGPEILTRTLKILDGAWGDGPTPQWRSAKSSAMVRGIARFVTLYPKTPDRVVIDALTKTPPAMIFARAAAIGKNGGSGKGRNIPAVILGVVGKNART